MIVPSDALRKSLEQATSRYQEQLAGSPAESYLIGRGLTKQALDYFRIGYVHDPDKGHETYAKRISIPYVTKAGVTSMRFRTLNPDSKAKYLDLVGEIPRLYNPLALTADRTGTKRLFICEGEIDTITCFMAGLNAVGLPGADKWDKKFSRIFRGRRVVVLADNDDDQGNDEKDNPGVKLAKQVLRALPGSAMIKMPQGHDVNSYYQTEGVEALLTWVGVL